MRQAIVCVVLTVDPLEVGPLNAAIVALAGGLGPDFAILRARLPMLHFLSMFVFGERAGRAAGEPAVTPLFVIEANFDGAPGPFWAALEAVAGGGLRGLLGLCRPPAGRSGALFAAVTQAGARSPIAPLLERLSVFPCAAHTGNRGLSRERILRQDALFAAVQREIAGGIPPTVLAGGAAALHSWLRSRLLPLPGLGWLAAPYQAPVAARQQALDGIAFAGFLAGSLGVALLPWLGLGLLAGPAPAAACGLLTGAASLTRLSDIGDLATLAGRPRGLPPGHRAYPDAWWKIAGAAGLAAALLLAVRPRGAAGWGSLVVAGPFASLLLLLAALRRRERADPAPPDVMPDPALLRSQRATEDCTVGGSNHMASVVVIKPGGFRAWLIRFGMRALNLAVRATASDGYLGSMRSIHFAHWAIVDGGQRLMFLSNFDGSWESYLDDFIEKAHAGLTLAWSSCNGFPPARYLALDGATKGRQFKAWARGSMTPVQFFYSAYPQRTVNQIARQAALAAGLCAQTLSAEQAQIWAKGL